MTINGHPEQREGSYGDLGVVKKKTAFGAGRHSNPSSLMSWLTQVGLLGGVVSTDILEPTISGFT